MDVLVECLLSLTYLPDPVFIWVGEERPGEAEQEERLPGKQLTYPV